MCWLSFAELLPLALAHSSRTAVATSGIAGSVVCLVTLYFVNLYLT